MLRPEVRVDWRTRVQPTRSVGGRHVGQLITAVDGSVVETLSTIGEAAYLTTKNGDSRSAWQLHTHFDVDRNMPTRIDITTGKNSGPSEEKHVLSGQLAPDHCYLSREPTTARRRTWLLTPPSPVLVCSCDARGRSRGRAYPIDRANRAWAAGIGWSDNGRCGSTLQNPPLL